MRSREQGFTTIEFAVAGVAFFILLFGVIEAGRWLFAVNTLAEATRRGARYAAMCADVNKIKSVALFGTGTSTPLTTQSPVLSDLTASHVATPTYWDMTQDPPDKTGDTIPDRAKSETNAVRVEITGYSLNLMIPGFAASVSMPASGTTVPIEVKDGLTCP